MALYSLYCADVPLRNCSLTEIVNGVNQYTFHGVHVGRHPHTENYLWIHASVPVPSICRYCY